MGAEASRQAEIANQIKNLSDLRQNSGDKFPGSDYHPQNRKTWMSGLHQHRIQINKIVWPGTHNSATNGIGFIIPLPFAECQTLSIYNQLVLGTRVLDIRIQEGRHVCHGSLLSYSIDVVIYDVKRFLSETQSEIIILEIRTEYGHQDPPDFEKYLIDQLGEFFIHPDDNISMKTISDLLPKRIICIWKPRNSPAPNFGSPLWSAWYLQDNWIDTFLPQTKFESNLKYLGQQPPVSDRRYFYRVENTVTLQADNPPDLFVRISDRIHGFARLFIAQCFTQGIADRLEILSTDFIDESFVDACVGLTQARILGRA